MYDHNYKTKAQISRIKSSTYFAPITCNQESCLNFDFCHQIPSNGLLFARKKAKVFFLFNTPHTEDIDNTPCTSQAGLYFRDRWLAPFVHDVASSYLITYLIRCPSDDLDSKKKDNFAASDLAYCKTYFFDDLYQHRPEVIVVFGSNTFENLYKLAINKETLPTVERHSVSKLRGQPLTMQFSADYSATVYVCFSPTYILKSPASDPYFTEDRDRIINHFCPNKKKSNKEEIKVEKVDALESVSDTLDFMDFLTRGLPKNEMFDLAFDTETDNLNRVYNNRFLSWQFTYKPGHATFIPIDHPEKPIFENPKDKLKLIKAMQTLLNSSPEETRIAWIVAHNAKFDLSVLYGLYRILPRGSIPIWDTLLGMHWLDENRKAMGAVLEGKPYSLKTLGKEFFNFQYDSEALEKRADGDLVSLKFEELVQYAGSDTVLTWHLKQKQIQIAGEQPNNATTKLERFMRYYYSPASRAIAFMECNGIAVSKEHLEYLQGDESPIWNRITKIENVELQESPEVMDFRKENQKLLQGEDTSVDYEDDLWGDNDNDSDELPTLNINKKDQETAFYLDFLGLKPLAFSQKTKKATLNKAFLNHYAEKETYLSMPMIQKKYLDYYRTPIESEDEEDIFPKNPLQLILELRELSKLGNTYLSSISDMVENANGDCIDRRVRASFWLSGCDTGRLSSTSPNFQNLPSGRSKVAKEIKNLFQAERPSKKFPDGTCLIQLDYKTAEVRWAAIFANDQNLIRLFNEARDSLLAACSPESEMSEEEFQKTQLASDIHRRTASLMYNVTPDQVNKVQRQASKSIGFGLLFGMGVKTLATNNGWAEDEAQEKINKFFSTFPQLKTYLDQAPLIAKSQGYMETVMGRRRRLACFFETKSFKDAAKAERLAKNAPIQGQSSDGGTIGMFQFFQYLLDNKLEKRWLIQNVVHDSCLVQVPISDIEKACTVMQHYFVQGMADYIKEHFDFTLPLPIECEIEVGLKYGDLHKWDGRPSTLPKIIEKIKTDAAILWNPKPKKTDKAKDLDLLNYGKRKIII